MGLGRDEAIALVTALAVAFGVLVLALSGADRRAPPAGSPSTAAGGPPGCLEWTDGCITCRRTPDGPACSTPGIACTRGETRCLAR